MVDPLFNKKDRNFLIKAAKAGSANALRALNEEAFRVHKRALRLEAQRKKRLKDLAGANGAPDESGSFKENDIPF